MLLAYFVLSGAAHRLSRQTLGATFVDTISSQYSSSAQKWESSIKGHAAHLFWILAVISAAWTFIQVIMRQPDFADLFGTAMRFVFVTMLFFYLLDHGAGFAGDILRSTNQLAGDATGTRGLDYGAVANMGVKILVEVSSHISVWNGVVAVVAGIIAILILVVLASITVNLISVNCETWIVLSAGLIFLAFGATEWTRDISISYSRHLLAVGIKQFVTLLLAGIGLDILNSLYLAAQKTGWGTDLQALAVALVSVLILLLLVGKVPPAAAAMVGASTGNAGGHGVGSLFAAQVLEYKSELSI